MNRMEKKNIDSMINWPKNMIFKTRAAIAWYDASWTLHTNRLTKKMCLNILTVFISQHTIKTNIKAFFYELNKFLDFDLAYDLNQRSARAHDMNKCTFYTLKRHDKNDRLFILNRKQNKKLYNIHIEKNVAASNLLNISECIQLNYLIIIYEVR